MDSTQAFHAIINLFLIPLWLLSGALFLFRAHRDGFGAHVCQSVDLWRRGTAHADVSGSAQRISADCVDFDAGAVCAVHVRTGLCAGEPAHDEAGSVTTTYACRHSRLGAHRDDVEQTCGGTLLKMADRGYRTGILDLTQGEWGRAAAPKTARVKRGRGAHFESLVATCARYS